jgi:crotonobetainyl-CoA:carnitine CoA-transferase CaiB-like acyl-CoA transferase
MIEQADVVLENYSARVMEKFGLGWEDVHAINPRACMVRMPAFGLDGPWRNRAGFAMTVEQVSGLAWITGYDDMPLVVRGACDPLGGMHAVFALMMALENRRNTGEGQLVEVPLVEVAINLAAEQVIEFSAYGELLERAENRGPFSAPQGVYECAGDDELLAVAVPSDAHWARLREVMGDPDWARAPAFEQAAGRRARHDLLDEKLEAWLRGKPMAEAAQALQAAGVPAEPVVNPHFVYPNPQLDHRQFFQTMDHPFTGDTRYPGVPMRFSALPRAMHLRPPPTLGQHNDEVLGGELGLSEDDLERLREAKVIGDRPSFM